MFRTLPSVPVGQSRLPLSMTELGPGSQACAVWKDLSGTTGQRERSEKEAWGISTMPSTHITHEGTLKNTRFIEKRAKSYI